MTTADARDELARDIFVADNSKCAEEIMLADWAHPDHHYPYAYGIADGLIAAGYRRPRTITTVEELDALPDGSVVMGFDLDGEQLVSAKQYGEWRQAGTDDGWQAHGLIENHGELVVLWEPEA